MTFDLDDTIAAIASAPGGGVRGIVRISGPECVACVGQVVRRTDGGSLGEVRGPSCLRGELRLGEMGDVPLILYCWPTGRSYTRQPSAELHLPGSPPLLEAALAAVCAAGARLARPGEFTLRALLAGRIDLTQAEAVLGVIDARSHSELETALAQLAGGLACPLQALREELLNLVAHLEAGLDFAEEDIEFISPEELTRQLSQAEQQVQALEARMHSRGEAGHLPRVVLLGLPNSGKSSLLNALAGEPAAIVSEVAGTTRDFVTRKLALDGQECVIVDTAGRLPLETGAELEAASQRMAHTQAAQADLELLCLDASRPPAPWERAQLTAFSDRRRLMVWTKCDLPLATDFGEAPDAIRTSSVSGKGIDELRRAIRRELSAIQANGVIAGTSDRCRESLRLAGVALAKAIAAAQATGQEEIVAAEVRLALEEIGRVAGSVYTDEVLDRVFSRFCIGK